MKKSITQKFNYGCGIACFAFATDMSYEQAVKFLGPEQAISNRFWCKDLTAALNLAGKKYHHRYLKQPLLKSIYREGVIVLIARSKNYPTGHYLIYHGGQWMDPWVNIPYSRDITKARSGFRKRLPGRPLYAIFPD